MESKPGKEHEWLMRLAGEWTFDGEAILSPDQPPVKSTGTESVRAVGGLWIVAEGQGEMPGCGAATTILTLGYDQGKNAFVGTWIGSMTPYLWIYRGSLDASERVLTLDTEGPSLAGDGKMSRYQDIIEVVSDDHRTLSSQMLGEDGRWNRFMTVHYRRKPRG